MNPAPFLVDNTSAQQGYITSEPYTVEKYGVAEFRDEIMNRKVRKEEVLRDKYKKIIPHLCNTKNIK
ncbi:hypothetical protein [Fortiea sp. LEGE XX443]|uniref:hypothetical protein n=1 Tax=Fortiea sp. LEGE XX443 TaxID=1828611 RepID=UPI001D136D88|nr:hypothetical protein [Fortiea sp. LEGE XX443]